MIDVTGIETATAAIRPTQHDIEAECPLGPIEEDLASSRTGMAIFSRQPRPSDDEMMVAAGLVFSGRTGE